MTNQHAIRTTALILGTLSAIALSFAIISQKFFGYAPCELCMIQRYWHGTVVGLAFVAVITRYPRFCLGMQALALAICCGYSMFHVGVEQHWWQGTAACTGTTGATSVEDLRQQILSAPVVRCDEVRWHLLGLSMATYDAILTFLMAGFAVITLRIKR